MSSALYTGEDVTISINLVDDNFTLLSDLIVGVIINNKLMVTFKKSQSTVFADPEEDTQCFVKLTRAITKNWDSGMLSMEITKVVSDINYPVGKHIIYKDNIVSFQNALTKNS
jgi:uncharacterized protein (DUF1919 family)